MTVTVAFAEQPMCRVSIDATGLAAADIALVERSTDQVRWTTVRGAAEWPCSAGTFVRTLYDDEFTPGVVNYYRVRGIETGDITFVGHGATSSDANAAGNGTLAPALPGSLVGHDGMLLWATIRNSGTGVVDTAALEGQGWDLIVDSGNVGLFGRYYQVGDGSPTVSFTGGVANATITAKIAAWRRMSITPSILPQGQLNASAANVAYPGVNIDADDQVAVLGGWKQNAWTSVALPASWTAELQDIGSTLGDDASVWLGYWLQTDATDIAAGSLVVTGGANAISRALLAVFGHADYLNSQTGSVTPTLTSHWLKSLFRPFLNRPITPGPRRDRRYASRGTSLDVINRSLPIEVTDLRAAAAFDLLVRTADDAERQGVKNLLAGGDILLLQAPAGSRYETCYVAVGDVTEGILGASDVEHWLLPCGTRAAPESDVVGVTTTCDTILLDFATCADVLAEFATCVEVMEYVADPEDVIVP